MKRIWFVGVLLAGMTTLAGQAAEGDAAKGEKLFKGPVLPEAAARKRNPSGNLWP